DINREPLSYQQIITRAVILGNHISKTTVRHEHVGILLPNVNGIIITFMALQYSGRIPAMLNFTVGQQVLLQACNTGQIKTIYTSRKFIENAKLEELAKALEQQLNVIYLEDLRSQITFIDKLAGVLRATRIKSHYRKLTGK